MNNEPEYPPRLGCYTNSMYATCFAMLIGLVILWIFLGGGIAWIILLVIGRTN